MDTIDTQHPAILTLREMLQDHATRLQAELEALPLERGDEWITASGDKAPAPGCGWIIDPTKAAGFYKRGPDIAPALLRGVAETLAAAVNDKWPDEVARPMRRRVAYAVAIRGLLRQVAALA